jgi:hypothetical protein
VGLTVYLHKDARQLQELIAETAAASGISRQFVYKDYFICMALKLMVAADPDLVFKGLSRTRDKLFKVIENIIKVNSVDNREMKMLLDSDYLNAEQLGNIEVFPSETRISI